MPPLTYRKRVSEEAGSLLPVSEAVNLYVKGDPGNDGFVYLGNADDQQFEMSAVELAALDGVQPADLHARAESDFQHLLLWYEGPLEDLFSTVVDARVRTRDIAPAGYSRECLFTKLMLAVTGDTPTTLKVTPVINGELVGSEQVTISALADTAEEKTERHEIRLGRAGDSARRGIRGTFIAFVIEAQDTLGESGKARVEAPDLEFEVVDELVPDRTYHELAETSTAIFSPKHFYYGEKGSGSIGLFGRTAQDLSTSFGFHMEPVSVAPAGTDGECLFTALYLPVWRDNVTDYTLQVAAVVDDTELAAQDIQLTGVSSPVLSIHRVLFSRATEEGGTEVSRRALRGTWFRFEVRGAGALPDASLRFGSPELVYEVLEETQGAANAG